MKSIDLRLNHYRVLLFALLLLLVTSPALSYAEHLQNPETEIERQADLPTEQRSTIAQKSDSITVYTGHGQKGAPRFTGELVAIRPNGRLLYYNSTLDSYLDVDPVPNTSASVSYVGSERTDHTCNLIGGATPCQRNVIERVNLTTGRTVRLYSMIGGGGSWHDVDRINRTHYLVADINNDRAFIVNISNNAIVWEWHAQRQFSPFDSGGHWPTDWTHLNDVEYTENGLVMMSLRNHDQVIFVRPGQGMLTNWTLGADDNYDILYEQHNPDYIPESRGGPAVLVADSENSRIIEYQRTANGWNKTWVWMDDRLQWPRDADRLPNGHTLITDTHGSRIIEVNESGTIVWSTTAKFFGGYDSERLDTGDESAGGQSAKTLGLDSRTTFTQDLQRREDTSIWYSIQLQTRQFLIGIREAIPPTVVSGLLFIRPTWMSSVELIMTGLSLLTVLFWIGLELRWSSLVVRSPIRRPK